MHDELVANPDEKPVYRCINQTESAQHFMGLRLGSSSLCSTPDRGASPAVYIDTSGFHPDSPLPIPIRIAYFPCILRPQFCARNFAPAILRPHDENPRGVTAVR